MKRITKKRGTKRSMKRSTKRSTRKGGVYGRPHAYHNVNIPRSMTRRLANKGIIARRRKVPFKSSQVPVREVMGTLAYHEANPHGENAYMRHVSARSVHNQTRRLKEKMVKEDIRHEKEMERLMEEAIRKNQENAEVNAELERMMRKERRKEHRQAMNDMMRNFEQL
jgi:hypothetical protein